MTGPGGAVARTSFGLGPNARRVLDQMQLEPCPDATEEVGERRLARWRRWRKRAPWRLMLPADPLLGAGWEMENKEKKKPPEARPPSPSPSVINHYLLAQSPVISFSQTTSEATWPTCFGGWFLDAQLLVFYTSCHFFLCRSMAENSGGGIIL